MIAETQQSQVLYSRLARRYDSVFERAILAEGRLTSFVRRHMDGRSVLDLACGNGRWLNRFAPGGYVGLDLNDAMLEQARERYPYASFVQGDMTDIPFPDGSYEGVVSLFGAMGHLPPERQRRMVKEVRRVLVEGGTAIFTNGNMWSPFNLPTTLKSNRVKLEGIRFKVHSATPQSFGGLLEGFSILRLESYDFSYLPIMPLKLLCSLMNRDYRQAYGGIMDVLDQCSYVPMLRWFGKQLFAVCRKN
ncbi:MAG: class I SAM-dependent methyltransferase [Candidatus Brocadiia bacterium]|jgi:SAM-dependent methyltransferase